MSLIHTAKLCGANPFHYLTALQRNASLPKAHHGNAARIENRAPHAGLHSKGFRVF